ncbi:MAG: molybdopterin cofactor-binding domain-containing protein [Myxococcota bacterium]
MKVSRRAFLIAGGVLGGGLMLGIGAVGGGAAYVASHDRLAMQRTQQGSGVTVLAMWLKIDPSGQITLLSPHTEMGQGAQTGLRQLAAEELDVAWDQIVVEQAPPETAFATGEVIEGFLFGELDGWSKTFGSGFANRVADAMSMQMTGGSTAVRFTGWMSVRTAAASARQMILGAAAASLGVAVAELSTADGVVSHAGSGRSMTYGELASDAANQPLNPKPPLKDPSEWRYVGKAMPRFDLPKKVFGTAEYGIDVRVQGMVYAAARQVGPFGAAVASIDNEADVLARPGVSSVHIVTGGVAVVADNPWRAEQAVRMVKATTEPHPDDTLDTAQMFQRMDDALGDASSLATKGSTSSLLEGFDIEHTYRVPFLVHAPMEPMNCTVWEQDGALHVAAGVQNPLGARAYVAKVSGRPFDDVVMHAKTMGGGFGRRAAGGDGTQDFITQAIELHQATDQPVRLLWGREQDTRAGAFRSADTARIGARIHSDGTIMAWQSDSYAKLNEVDQAMPAYEMLGAEVRAVGAEPALPFAFWRSVDASSQCFFVESFVDECAEKAGANPLDYRLSMLPAADRRAAVLRMVREMSGFDDTVDAQGRAMGVAVNHCFGSYCAVVAQVSLQDGKPRVHNLYVAADCGVVVNPDSVQAQLQGGALFGLSAALYGRADIENGRVKQSNFHDYRVMKFADAPRLHIRTVKSDENPGGVGEVGTPAVAPAVCNALSKLGQRVRTLPVIS